MTGWPGSATSGKMHRFGNVSGRRGQEEWAEGRRASQVAVGTVFPQPSVVAKLAAFAQARDLPFVDLAPDFKAPARRPLFYPRDGHLNAQGHEVFAEAMVRHLTAQDPRTIVWLQLQQPAIAQASRRQ